jgi:hypothetical protein
MKRDNLEKYYTKPSIVELCINEIKKKLIINDTDLIIEPSAGSGAFINEIKKISNNYKFYDILPENEEIEKQDYLELPCIELIKNNNKIHIIGNPPFGRQSNIAIKFIKKSCKYANSISFILPKSFKKESLKKYFNENFHLISEIDLPKKSFLIESKEYNVPSIFQIWIKKDIKREKIEKLKPNDSYVFIKKTDIKKTDINVISFRRVGMNAGYIDKEIINKNIQTHYFIKFINNESLENNLKKISTLKFEKNNTVGPKSISTQELIKELNTKI